MNEHRDDCRRSATLLARLDAATGHGPGDPAAVLDEADLAWLASHLESCAACAPAPELTTSLAALLRDDDTELPGDDFFAARRAALLDVIRTEATGARDGGVVGAGAVPRVATRPALRAVPGTGARAGTGGARSPRRRSLWRPLLPAVAAALAIAIGLGVLRARTPRPIDTEVAVVEVASGDLVAAVGADADDSWVVESDDLFEVALSSTSDPALDELSDDDLEEIEGVFVPSPGWS